MKTLGTRNLRYIGSVLTDFLKKKGHDLIGLDIGYIEKCNILPVKKLKHQIKKDYFNGCKTNRLIALKKN
jgi:hypothetical protein